MEVQPLEPQIKTEVIHTEIELKVENEDFYAGEIPESDPKACDFELVKVDQVADETTLEGSSNSTVSQVCILCRRGTIECEKNEIVVHCRVCQKNLRERKKNLFLMKIKQLYKSCLICVNVFYNNLAYERHDCTLEGAFVCDGCRRIFVEKENLIVHINKCNKIIPKINKNNDNGRSESKSELKVLNCEGAVGLNENGNVYEIAASAGNVTAQSKLSDVHKRFSCSFCGKRFPFNAALKRHERTHTGEKPYACIFCNKTFNHTGHLSRHLLVHTGEKPHSCTVCEKSFNQACHLRRHFLLHTGEKPYHCIYCDKNFSDKTTLKGHIRIHTRSKPYVCTFCDKSFSRGRNLKEHLLLHSGKKPYCKVCNKNFSRSHYLVRHLQIHTGERPYNCNVCEKCFARADSLRSHMRLHTGDTPYKCKLCDKKYTHGSNLKIHLLVHKRKKL